VTVRRRRAPPRAYHVLSRWFYLWGIRSDLRGAPEGSDRLPYLLDRARRRYGTAFRDHTADFESLLAALASRRFADDGELRDAIVDGLHAFAVAHFTREELEARYAAAGARPPHSIFLNEILDCEIDEKRASRLKLHLKPTSRMTAGRLRHAFATLAGLLRSEPRLAAIETIALTSWMVAEHPRLIRQFGFTIRPARREGTGQAVMARAQLLARYGRERTPPDGAVTASSP